MNVLRRYVQRSINYWNSLMGVKRSCKKSLKLKKRIVSGIEMY